VRIAIVVILDNGVRSEESVIALTTGDGALVSSKELARAVRSAAESLGVSPIELGMALQQLESDYASRAKPVMRVAQRWGV
jgi:glycine/D-amino acid oxidase-like deaminating enzyme